MCFIVSSWMEAQKKLKQTTVNISAYYGSVTIHYSHLIPVKSFSFGVSNSKSLEINVNLSIRPKMIISDMLVLIPEINEKNICKLPLPLLSPHTMNTVMHSYDTSAVLSLFFPLKTGRNLDKVFKPVQFLSLLPVPHFFFKLLARQNVSCKCADNILFRITSKFP